MPMFRIKICGITSVEDVRLVEDAGADAIGFNFAAQSSRMVSVEQATELVSAVERRLVRVGVFVDGSVDEVNEIAATVGLDVVQLHGDQSPEFALKMKAPVVKAIAYDERGVQPILGFWDEYQSRATANESRLLGVLIDACVGGQFGGTGENFDWSRLAAERAELDEVPWVLAGGLSDQNVAEAIRQVGPHGVDVASGVEMAPGKKDVVKTRDFVRNAREALGL